MFEPFMFSDIFYMFWVLNFWKSISTCGIIFFLSEDCLLVFMESSSADEKFF